MRSTPLGSLEEPYRTRAAPPGSPRYWSWLFAAREGRQPLLAVYALTAEWHALLDPALDAGVARLKLGWWREEMERLSAGSPLHPISRHLAAFPAAATADFPALVHCVEAFAAQLSGVPLERSTDLAPHAAAMFGTPLRIAAMLSAAPPAPGALDGCLAALASAQYLARAVAGYRRDAEGGRIPFAIDELLAAGIENDELCAVAPGAALRDYLSQVRQRAAAAFTTADAALVLPERRRRRHLLVLAGLGRNHVLACRDRHGSDFRWADLYNAWHIARRAAAQR